MQTHMMDAHGRAHVETETELARPQASHPTNGATMSSFARIERQDRPIYIYMMHEDLPNIIKNMRIDKYIGKSLNIYISRYIYKLKHCRCSPLSSGQSRSERH
eukprot:GHVU01092676.1.p1 GENE.GHVU01092676.1~~GHVU01092676.1.p1  ORF type:complete len:103 (-),score=7.91 GHVU01092676.1:17-325(-)